MNNPTYGDTSQGTNASIHCVKSFKKHQYNDGVEPISDDRIHFCCCFKLKAGL